MLLGRSWEKRYEISLRDALYVWHFLFIIISTFIQVDNRVRPEIKQEDNQTDRVMDFDEK